VLREDDVGFGVEGGEDGGLGHGFNGARVRGHLLEEAAYCTQLFFGFGDFGTRGEDAECGVGCDLFDCLFFGRLFVVAARGFADGFWFGEIDAGDLEAVEEEAGAAGVDVVGGDAAEDFSDGVLDGGAVFWQRQVEGGATASALAWVFDRLACGVVVVAELFAAEAWAGAATSVGEDVAALVFDG
jgi:hypothetical protein